MSEFVTCPSCGEHIYIADERPEVAPEDTYESLTPEERAEILNG